MPEKTANGGAETGFPPMMMMMPFGFDAFMEFNRPALAAMAQVNGKVYDGISAMNKNWVAFVNRRLKEDLAMPKHLADCKTVQDMYGVYAEFFQTAYADYQHELEQITKLGKSLADDTLHVVQSRMDEAARESRQGK
ncbi:MAG: phasin family protein [Hyphomicrobiaceae bacterium]|nr:MAG: phasin family protein [Hyphomicrobiaceae bacterium]